jgi:predicted TPR repeat methyltransferase
MAEDAGPRSLADAERLLAEGHPRRAAEVASAWLSEHPESAAAHHVLGASQAALGAIGPAVVSLGRAAELAPEDATHRMAFATALALFGDVPRALKEVEVARRLDPSSTFGGLEFGLACLCRGHPQEALGHFEPLCERDSGDPMARVAVALAHAAAGDVDRARTLMSDAARLDPDAHLLAGRIATGLERQRRPDDAHNVLELATLAGADDPELSYRIAAASGGGPTRAPDEYVTHHFDRFAEAFDTHLEELRYRAPELLVELARRHIDLERPLAVLDGGCGTGFWGPLLRPLAARLVGIDLSGRMLVKARERGVYDELVQSELTEALFSRPEQFDLVVCADVLVYFGDLLPLFAACGESLRPGGILAVSTERAEDGAYLLQRNGRFAHSDAYVRNAAEQAALEWLESTPTDLRLENGAWIPGALTVFRRPRAA